MNAGAAGIQIDVLFFGPARDWFGADRAAYSLPEGATLKTLADELKAGAKTRPLRFAVNRAFVADDHLLAAGDEVAVIPPVSGG